MSWWGSPKVKYLFFWFRLSPTIASCVSCIRQRCCQISVVLRGTGHPNLHFPLGGRAAAHRAPKRRNHWYSRWVDLPLESRIKFFFRRMLRPIKVAWTRVEVPSKVHDSWDLGTEFSRFQSRFLYKRFPNQFPRISQPLVFSQVSSAMGCWSIFQIPELQCKIASLGMFRSHGSNHGFRRRYFSEFVNPEHWRLVVFPP